MKHGHLNTEDTSTITGSATPANMQVVGKVSTAAQVLKRSLDTFLAKDIKGWAELCDENVIVEFPFAPDPTTRRLVGREAVFDYLKDYPKLIDIKSAPTMSIHGTDDPNLAYAEWSVSGKVLTNGNPYEMSYATFVNVKDGLIVNYREYWNPMAFMSALDGSMF